MELKVSLSLLSLREVDSGIHYMELKAAYYARRILRPARESITWSWKGWGCRSWSRGPSGIHYMELKDPKRLVAKVIDEDHESITWSWKINTTSREKGVGGAWGIHYMELKGKIRLRLSMLMIPRNPLHGVESSSNCYGFAAEAWCESITWSWKDSL